MSSDDNKTVTQPEEEGGGVIENLKWPKPQGKEGGRKKKEGRPLNANMT